MRLRQRAGAAADNEYIVVVEVRSGEGERERKGIRRRDPACAGEWTREEPPGAPGAPVVTAGGHRRQFEGKLDPGAGG